MPRPVLVVGLSGRNPDTGWNTILDGRSIVARTRSIAEQTTDLRRQASVARHLTEVLLGVIERTVWVDGTATLLSDHEPNTPHLCRRQA